LLKAATSSEDRLFYPFMLRYIKDGWTLEQRKIAFEALNLAEKMNGASTFFKAISDTRSELAAALKPEEAVQLAALIHPPKPATLSPHALPGHTFKNWKLEDLEPLLTKMDAKTRNRDSARDALIRTQCVFCHRVSADPKLPAGVYGPDLTLVSARFGRKDLLDHILSPSKFIDEKFRLVTVQTSDGKTLSGSLESEDDERVVLKPNPLAPETVEVGKAMIKQRTISEISPMPAGLLNSLKAEQILDMLAWFETMK
jgi:putative heme-binding domain-containing protein